MGRGSKASLGFGVMFGALICWCALRMKDRCLPSSNYHPGQERAFAEASGVLEQISTLADTVPYQHIFFFDLKH